MIGTANVRSGQGRRAPMWSGWLAAALTLQSCGQVLPESRTIVSEASPDQIAADVFKRVGLTPPPSARIEFAEYQNGLDDNARVIMVMPAADWVTMQATPPLNAVRPEAYAREGLHRLGTSDAKWRAREDPSVVVAQMKVNGSEYLNVGIGDASGGRVRVYLFWFQT